MSSFAVPVFAEEKKTNFLTTYNSVFEFSSQIDIINKIVKMFKKRNEFDIPPEYKYITSAIFYNAGATISSMQDWTSNRNYAITYFYSTNPATVRKNFNRPYLYNFFFDDCYAVKIVYEAGTHEILKTYKPYYFSKTVNDNVCDYFGVYFKFDDVPSNMTSGGFNKILSYNYHPIVSNNIDVESGYFDSGYVPESNFTGSDIPNYNETSDYDGSYFDTFPKLDFSNCDGILDYVKTFFTWLGDVFLWFIKPIKDFFAILFNIDNFIKNFLSDFVGKLVNTVKEIANKFIDTLIERVKDITNAVAEVVLEFLKKWFIPSDEFIQGKLTELNDFVIEHFGDYTVAMKALKSFTSPTGGLGSVRPEAPIIVSKYKDTVLTIDFSFLDPFIENVRVFIGALMCIAQGWWFVRRLPSLIGGVSGIDLKQEPEHREIGFGKHKE